MLPVKTNKAAGGVHGGDAHTDGMPWLHGALNRIDAEALLKGKNKGHFLVRTKANAKDSYVLTLKLQKVTIYTGRELNSAGPGTGQTGALMGVRSHSSQVN